MLSTQDLLSIFGYMHTITYDAVSVICSYTGIVKMKNSRDMQITSLSIRLINERLHFRLCCACMSVKLSKVLLLFFKTVNINK